MRGRLPVAILAIVAVALSGCARGAADAGGATDSASGLPIAAAPSSAPSSPEEASAAVPASEPAWTEPDDPVAAYRELIDKVAFMRAYPSLAMARRIYAPRSRMARELGEIERMAEEGIRVIDGRTVLEDVRLLSKDDDTAFLRVRSREQGWVTVGPDGDRSQEPTMCERFVVELRDRGEGWRIATLIVDDKSFRRCEA